MENEEYYEEQYEERSEKKLRGFTLIELIVVIAIIGILASIIVPTMIGYMEQANNAADAENARIICAAIQAEAMYEPNFEVFTLNPWGASGGQEADDHGYIYVDKDEVRVSSYRLAELLQEQGFITSAADDVKNLRSSTSITKDGIEVARQYVYHSPACSRMLCKSSKTWYRYQVNIYYRDGTINFSYSAASKNGTEIGNDTNMSSKSNTIDREASKAFAKKAGLGEADMKTSLGPESLT